MFLIKTQPKLLMGKANPAGERHCNKQRAKSLLRSVSINHCLCAGGGGGRTARGRVCECAALRATASRAWSGGGSATAATTRPPRTPGHTGRRHSHQTFGKLFLCIYSTFTPQFKYFPLSSTKVHTYYQYLKSVCLTRRCTLQDC